MMLHPTTAELLTVLLLGFFSPSLFAPSLTTITNAAPPPPPAPRPPHIVFVLSDDQDVTLSSMEYMPKTKQVLGQTGVSFSNMFAATPICCPSRASFLSGRYQHNTKTLRNFLSDNCYGSFWRNSTEKRTYAAHIHDHPSANYVKGYFGKYLNQYGHDEEGGVKRIPYGWDHWFGLVGNSVYYNYTVSDNGLPERHYNDYLLDYFPDLLVNRSISWLKYMLKNRPENPVLLVVGTPSIHGPFAPAPQFADMFDNLTAPRTPNFNTGIDDKHWFVSHHRVMNANEIALTDLIYRRRMETLQTVDNFIFELHRVFADNDLLHNTWFIYSSDNGFHSGQFTFVEDKRLPYEEDIRIPLIVSGPGIPPSKRGSTISDIALNIDIAPTILDLAGVEVPSDMDGKSLMPGILSENNMEKWRTDFLIEYWGQAHDGYMPAPQFAHPPFYTGGQPWPSIMDDATNNTYDCLRTISSSCNTIYCRFYLNDDDAAEENAYFEEYYDINSDQFQLRNSVNMLSVQEKQEIVDRLHKLRHCSGQAGLSTCVP